MTHLIAAIAPRASHVNLMLAHGAEKNASPLV